MENRKGRQPFSILHPLFASLRGQNLTRVNPDMKKIAFLFLMGALAFGGCDLFKSKKAEKKPAARTKAELREENTDVDFQAFVGRLKKAVAAHDVNAIAGMMTEDFAYVLGKTSTEDR